MVQQTYQAWQTNFYKKPPLFILKSPKGTKNLVNSRGWRAKFYHSGFSRSFIFFPRMRRLTAWLTTPGWIAHLFDGIKTKRKLAKIPKNQEGPIIAYLKNSTSLSLKEFDHNRYFYWNQRQNFNCRLNGPVDTIDVDSMIF